MYSHKFFLECQKGHILVGHVRMFGLAWHDYSLNNHVTGQVNGSKIWTLTRHKKNCVDQTRPFNNCVKFDYPNPFIRVMFVSGIRVVSNFANSKEKARIDIHVDHSKAYENLFRYAIIIQKFDTGGNCKVLFNAVIKPNKVLF